MQVVILCGGQGTRIRDVADDVPKPMIPIGQKPILWHIMKGFAHHGFTDFILCLGYKSWAIKRYFLDYYLANASFSVDLGSRAGVKIHADDSSEQWRVTLVETGAEAMTGARVKRIEPYVTGDNFLLTYGDGVADIDIANLVRIHRDHGKIGTVTAVQPPGRFGDLELVGDRVLNFMEKTQLSDKWINGGFFVFQRRFFEYLRNDESLVLEKAPLTQLARDDELVAHRHSGFWQCMDSSRDFRLLNDLWSQGNAAWNVWDRVVPLRAAG